MLRNLQFSPPFGHGIGPEVINVIRATFRIDLVLRPKMPNQIGPELLSALIVPSGKFSGACAAKYLNHAP